MYSLAQGNEIMKAKTQKQIEQQDDVLQRLRRRARNKVILDTAPVVSDGALSLEVNGQKVQIVLVFDGPRTLKHVYRVIVTDALWSNHQFTRTMWRDVNDLTRRANRA